MALTSSLVGIGNWIFRTAALRAARSQVAKSAEATGRAANQVRLLIEVARRVIEPADALPAGARAAVLLTLYRDAAYWMLTALGQPAEGSSSDLATLWAAAAPDRLLRAAGDPETLAAVRAALLGQSPTETLNATDEMAAHARAFVESLLWEFDAPYREVDRVRLQRWTRVGGVVVVVVLMALGIRQLAIGPNLAEGRPFRTSSSLPECPPHTCADLLFHTLNEENPWVDFDLAAVHKVHLVEVTNRSDCCAERAVPLIIEVSIDDKQWTQVARRDATFTTWTATFPAKQARHVRLRVPRNTAFHLDRVVIR